MTTREQDLAWIRSVLSWHGCEARLLAICWDSIVDTYHVYLLGGWHAQLSMQDVAERNRHALTRHIEAFGLVATKPMNKVGIAIADGADTSKEDVPRAACAWCKRPECKTEGTYCSGYLSCLAERVVAGANDCAEERASVERWCDARRLEWEANGNPLRDPPPKCAECCWAPAPSTLGFMRGGNGQALCAYCFHETVGGQFSRAQVDRGVSWQTRPASAFASAPEPKQQPWQAWATPTEES